MRKSFLGLIALLFMGITLQAQSPGDALKDAKKFLTKANLEENSDKQNEFLAQAKEQIDIASAGIQSIDAKDHYKLWSAKGEIYNKMAKMDSNMSFINPNHKAKYPEAASTAFEAFKQTMPLALKKWQKSDALNNILSAAGSMTNAGRVMYTEKNYKGALNIFEKAIAARELLMENGENGFLSTDVELNDHIFMTALAASISKNTAAATKYFGKLYDAKYDNAAIYDGYFRALKDTDKEKAVEVLAKGREMYPEDEGLLIAEINYYLAEEKLDVLVDRLKTAIAKDATNTTYVSTLGNVYDNLSVREAEAGNAAKSSEYFNLALEYYNKALDMDPNYHTALYNAGTLYYNKAAILTKEMVELSSDYSKAGTAKYNAKKVEVFANFDKALPYFQKAEVIDPNDLGTLTALKEIYAKKDDLEKSTEFKKRLENAQGGGKNEVYHKM